MTLIGNFARTIFLLSLFNPLVLAQKTAMTRHLCENDRLDINAPPVTLTFDHTDTTELSNGKSQRVYWMKLHNNTKCAIGVTTPKLPSFHYPVFARDEKGQFVRNELGGLVIRKDSTLRRPRIPNNSQASVIYSLFNSKNKSIGTGNLDGCITYITDIHSNNWVLLPVSPWQFKKGHYIEIHFQYVDNDQQPSLFEPDAKVRFDFNNLPAETFKNVTK